VSSAKRQLAGKATDIAAAAATDAQGAIDTATSKANEALDAAAQKTRQAIGPVQEKVAEARGDASASTMEPGAEHHRLNPWPRWWLSQRRNLLVR